jgi:hypothetical protein
MKFINHHSEFLASSFLQHTAVFILLLLVSGSFGSVATVEGQLRKNSLWHASNGANTFLYLNCTEELEAIASRDSDSSLQAKDTKWDMTEEVPFASNISQKSMHKLNDVICKDHTTKFNES